MFGRFKSALFTAISSLEESEGEAVENGVVAFDAQRNISTLEKLTGVGGGVRTKNGLKQKYPYQRPEFLGLSNKDEIQVTADHLIRPIIVPRDPEALPWHAGYAEAINAGKSARNEDQTVFHQGLLRIVGNNCESSSLKNGLLPDVTEIPYWYFGIFDGHAGAGCAVASSKDLHKILHKRLTAIQDYFILPPSYCAPDGKSNTWSLYTKDISLDSLIIGALESAFLETDSLIGDDKKKYKMLGGCTVLVSLFICGKLFVANAGDSRAVVYRKGEKAYPMSFDFTPISERNRLQKLAKLQPFLLGDDFTHCEYSRRPMLSDVGTKMLYRDANMVGWAYKEITHDDLRFPVVHGEGKRSRLLATIGVTRGFGDHDLMTQTAKGPLPIKPFLSPHPEVNILDLSSSEFSSFDVLVMATDGLWDVISNEKVESIIHECFFLYNNDEVLDEKSLNHNESVHQAENSKFEISRTLDSRYNLISLAQDLVMYARGKLINQNWRLHSDTCIPATIDDVSVLIIPLLPYATMHKTHAENQKVISTS